ncbi:MAG: precorrin-6A reductase [Lachnospiraceae bacterium]|nr:precorrin-6A reductase [Lachnospiraceae bacterium]
MSRIVLFAGTTEGRELCEFLQENKLGVTAHVATEYGKGRLMETEYVKVVQGRMNENEMYESFLEEKPELVVDATHPYAVEVTDNISEACKRAHCSYVRLLRDSVDVDSANLIWVSGIREAAEYIARTRGNVLLTTGSKEIGEFANFKDKDRIYIRILPNPDSLRDVIDMGFSTKQMICLHGPFSEELNYALMKECDIKYMITKESGNQGGYVEKIKAAQRAGVKVIVIRRPRQETGLGMSEVIQYITKEMLEK